MPLAKICRYTPVSQRGIKISDRLMRELEKTHITCHDWRPQWNYTINPAAAA